MLNHSNGKSIILDKNIKPGAVWWVSNEYEGPTNLIKKTRPFIILDVSQGYESFKVTGIMLQSRTHFLTSKYEYIVDRMNDGRYSVADVSNITTVNVEDLISYMYETPKQIMNVIRGFVSDLANPTNEKRFGQVWQYDNQDYLIYRVTKNPVTKMVRATILPIQQKSSSDIGLCDVVLGSVDQQDNSILKVVTIGTEVIKDANLLSLYKYTVSDISIGKLNEGFTKINSMKKLISNSTVMDQVDKILKDTIPSEISPNYPKPIKNTIINRTKPRYRRK